MFFELFPRHRKIYPLNNSFTRWGNFAGDFTFCTSFTVNIIIESFPCLVSCKNEKIPHEKSMRMEDTDNGPANTKYRLFMVYKGLWHTVATLCPIKFCFRFKLFCFSFFLFYFLNNIFCFSFHLPFIQFILNFWMATIGYHITSSRRIPQGYVLSHLRKTLIDLPWPLKERGSQNNAMFRSC